MIDVKMIAKPKDGAAAPTGVSSNGSGFVFSLAGIIAAVRQDIINFGLDFGDIRVSYDAPLGALALTRISNASLLASLHATGDLTAFGAGGSSNGGGGGNDYDRLDKWADYTDDKSGWVLSAYLGEDLNKRVAKLEAATITNVDWSVITNKPTSLAGYGILDVKIEGKTITLGTSSISLPTNVSELVNDAKYITASDNVASATKLATARKIWGQPFDGTADVTGNLLATYFGIFDSATNPYLQLILNKTPYYIQVSGNGISMGPHEATSVLVTAAGNVGIGVVTPACKLDVNGDVKADNVRIGDIKISYDATNGALALTRISDATTVASLYATGGISAYGAGASGGGGGSDYNRLDKWADYTDDKSGWVLSAYLGEDLNKRVAKLEAATITSVDWSAITHTPTSIAGYGILDANIDGQNINLGAKTLKVPLNVSELTNDTGFITASANVASATKLATVRKLWGQPFDGTADVSGALTGVTTLNASGVITAPTFAGNATTASQLKYLGIYDEATTPLTGFQLRAYGTSSSGYQSSYGISLHIQAESFWYNRLDFATDGLIYFYQTINPTTLKGSMKLIGRLAYVSDNVASATKLATARTLWGVSFDGTKNIGGTLLGTYFGLYDLATNPYLQLTLDKTPYYLQVSGRGISIGPHEATSVLVTAAGNVGISNVAPAYKLDIAGTLHATDAVLFDKDLTVTGNVLAHGGVTAYTTSDRREKDNIRAIDNLAAIRSLGGTYQFEYKVSGMHSIGLIAQNVQRSIIPDIVGKSDDRLQINYLDPKLISLALGASTELDIRLVRAERKIKILESTIKQLKAKLS